MNILILGAGHGIRMKSSIPKIFLMYKQKPLIEHILQTVSSLGKVYVVVQKQYVERFPFPNVHLISQKHIKGTASAVLEALPYLHGNVLILNGDMPNIKRSTLQSLLQQNKHCIILHSTTPNTNGRVMVQGSYIKKIIEYKDCTEEEKKITYVNAGIYYVSKDMLQHLHKITNENAQQEYYLTDLYKYCKLTYMICEDSLEFLNVNTVEDLKK